jgi:hypothetical protein
LVAVAVLMLSSISALTPRVKLQVETRTRFWKLASGISKLTA